MCMFPEINNAPVYIMHLNRSPAEHYHMSGFLRTRPLFQSLSGRVFENWTYVRVLHIGTCRLQQVPKRYHWYIQNLHKMP